MFSKLLIMFCSLVSTKALALDSLENVSGSEVVVENIAETQTVSPVIKGQTIKNLATIDSDYEIRNNNGWFINFTITETANLKLNTPYTMFVYKENLENHNSEYNVMEIGVGNVLNSTLAHPVMTMKADSTYFDIGFRADNTKDVEVFKGVMTFKSFNGYKYLSIRPMRRRDSNPVDTEYCNSNAKIVLLEGDWSDYDIEYFTGTKSVEEVLVKSQSVNLFDISGNINEKYDNMLTNDYNELVEDNGIKLNDFSSTSHGRGPKFNLKPNTDYTLSFKSEDKTSISICTSTEVNYISVYFSGNTSFTFNTGDISEMIIGFTTPGNKSTDKPAVIYDLMLREAIYPDNYSVYGNSTKSTSLTNGINGIDDVYDYILKDGSNYKIERNFKEIALDENTMGEYSLSIDSDNILSLSKEGLNVKPNGKSISGKLSLDATFDTSLRDYIYSLESSSLIKIKIAGLTSIDAYKNYFKNNPTNIIYELENREYETLKDNLDILIFEGTTVVNLDSNVLTNISFDVDRKINYAYEAIEKVKESPTLENISNARYWINRLDECALKDSLNEVMAEVSNAEDLEIEKKTSTANVDMYLRFKNTLAISLETSSITFEDFSGVESLTKSDAIKLNVSSSLSYEVNSSLATSILSSSNNKLSDSVLSIKPSNLDDSSYKSFDGATKLKLLSSDYGDSNSHSFDLKLNTLDAFKADVYKAVIKIEVNQT